MADDLSSAQARARALVAQFDEALDRQISAADARSWPHAPKHIREAHGDPNLPDPPSEEAMDAWEEWLGFRMNSRIRARLHLENGRHALIADPARADVYWNRAISLAERALAELEDSPDFLDGRPDSLRASGAIDFTDQAPYNAPVAWTVAAYGAAGLGTLIVLGVGGFVLGQPAGTLVLFQIVLLVIGFLPALEIMHRLLEGLASRAADAGKPPESTDTAAVVLPFLAPVGYAVLSWLIVT